MVVREHETHETDSEVWGYSGLQAGLISTVGAAEAILGTLLWIIESHQHCLPTASLAAAPSSSVYSSHEEGHSSVSLSSKLSLAVPVDRSIIPEKNQHVKLMFYGNVSCQMRRSAMTEIRWWKFTRTHCREQACWGWWSAQGSNEHCDWHLYCLDLRDKENPTVSRLSYQNVSWFICAPDKPGSFSAYRKIASRTQLPSWSTYFVWPQEFQNATRYVFPKVHVTKPQPQYKICWWDLWLTL